MFVPGGPIVLMTLLSLAQTPSANPHYDPIYGVNRIPTDPPTIGECSQCHPLHDNEGVAPEPKILFAPNDNQLCYGAGGIGGCHDQRPPGYPAIESDRLPETADAPGYFEANSGGQRTPGVLLRRRWPGMLVFEDTRVAANGHYYSPHRNDPDMPIEDGDGSGLCRNCHDPHEGAGPHDLLKSVYQPWGGSWPGRAAVRMAACLDCHGSSGPVGMDAPNRLIADYYDPAVNNDQRAGHQIRRNPEIAISWPSYMRAGDPLPCYECHNPHGSRGNDGVSPNAFLISDERPGWRGLVDTQTNPAANRAFCLGCHIPANGVPGSITVDGIVMNTLPDEGGHAATDVRGCFGCHGSDYSSATSENVHHPGEGED